MFSSVNQGFRNYRLVIVVLLYILSLIFLFLAFINDYHNVHLSDADYSTHPLLKAQRYAIWAVTLSYVASLLQESSKKLFVAFLLFIFNLGVGLFLYELSIWFERWTIVFASFVIAAYVCIPRFSSFVIFSLLLLEAASFLLFGGLIFAAFTDRDGFKELVELFMDNAYSFLFVYSFLSVVSVRAFKRFMEKWKGNGKRVAAFSVAYAFVISCIMFLCYGVVKKESLQTEVDVIERVEEMEIPNSLCEVIYKVEDIAHYNVGYIKPLSMYLTLITIVNLVILFLNVRLTRSENRSVSESGISRRVEKLSSD